MSKEQVLYINFDKQPITRDRQIYPKDCYITCKDKEGNKITLTEDKKLYPFKLDNTVRVKIQTNIRTLELTIHSDYRWNGADIPQFLWSLVGSQYNPEFKIPSMIHDYMLEFKEPIYYRYITDDMTVAEYRRLTSLIFRELLKKSGVKTIKSNFMSWTVQMYQTLFNRKGWDI